MTHSITFNFLHEYDTKAVGITVPVELKVGQMRVRVPDAKLDTGSNFCIFQHGLGESLGLDIESGHPERIKTPTGAFLAYGHEVSLSALGFEFDVIVYFADIFDFSRNVLGRHGWLQQLRLAIIDYDGKLFVSPYDDEN